MKGRTPAPLLSVTLAVPLGCASWTATGVIGFSNGASDAVEWSSD